ncbi:DUF721 domain-containing protein [Pseudenhygromyxa sp. WMMC2535]|uniref:DUF721 domain-containing protein n=1 Tax=Pseudenhygromyxa sp. WMMC2535 TaxID=2712867 RepID=UPI001554797A|nr:DUF721 domain-containing protein [Pseudenhygromyxa sp. WMMC2535]NVB41403.1 DUF721 domain-containing protein [Pseudenhygromyxa sp. WMMC2535]
MAEEVKRKRWRGRDIAKRRGLAELGALVREVVDRHVPPERQRLSRLRNLWIELLPPRFADHVWPMQVRGERLIVHVHDSQWLHEMTYWRQELLDRLGQAAPDLGLESIEAFVGPLPPMSERRPEAPEPIEVDHEPVLPEETPSETLEALDQIRDDRLREALKQARVMLGKPR